MHVTIHRTMALVKRHMYLQFRDVHRLIDIFYWPVIDLAIWGFTGLSMIDAQSNALILLTSILLWTICYRTDLEVCVNVIEELWGRNLMNLFTTPFTLFEWALGLMILGLLRTMITILVFVVAAYYMYGINLLSVGWILLPCIFLLIMSGWWIGFFFSSILIYWGAKMQSLAWASAWLFAPVSGVFYPLSVLPVKVQAFSWCLPMTYVFDGLRTYITTGTFPYTHLYMSAGLNIFYCALSMLLFWKMFNASKEYGLARLEE